MPVRSSSRSSFRSSTRSYKPTLTVKKRTSSWFTKKTEVKKVIVNKKYGYKPYYTAPVIIGTGTTIYHDDDDYVPYQDNGMSGYGFMAFVLTLAVVVTVGIIAYRRFA